MKEGARHRLFHQARSVTVCRSVLGMALGARVQGRSFSHLHHARGRRTLRGTGFGKLRMAASHLTNLQNLVGDRRSQQAVHRWFLRRQYGWWSHWRPFPGFLGWGNDVEKGKNRLGMDLDASACRPGMPCPPAGRRAPGRRQLPIRIKGRGGQSAWQLSPSTGNVGNLVGDDYEMSSRNWKAGPKPFEEEGCGNEHAESGTKARFFAGTADGKDAPEGIPAPCRERRRRPCPPHSSARELADFGR